MNKNKIPCPDCGKSITTNNIGKHQNSKVCQNSKIIRIDEFCQVLNGKYLCPHCNKEYSKKGIATHIWRTHGEGQNFTANNDGRTAWNKGLTKKTDNRVKANSIASSIVFQNQISNGTYKKRIKGEEARKILSESQSIKNTGGKSKWFEVNNTFVQGTWERDCALKFCEFNIEWKKIKKDMMTIYQMEGKLKNYTPDIFIPSLDMTLEIKGFWWGNDEEKMQCVLNSNPELGNKIFFVFKNDFIKIINATTKDDILVILNSLTSLRDYFTKRSQS